MATVDPVSAPNTDAPADSTVQAEAEGAAVPRVPADGTVQADAEGAAVPRVQESGTGESEQVSATYFPWTKKGQGTHTLLLTPVLDASIGTPELVSILEAYERAKKFPNPGFVGVHVAVNGVVRRQMALLQVHSYTHGEQLCVPLVIAVDCCPRGGTELFDVFCSKDFQQSVDAAMHTTAMGAFKVDSWWRSGESLSKEQQLCVLDESVGLFVFARDTGELIVTVPKLVLRGTARMTLAMRRAGVETLAKMRRAHAAEVAAKAVAQQALQAQQAQRMGVTYYPGQHAERAIAADKAANQAAAKDTAKDAADKAAAKDAAGKAAADNLAAALQAAQQAQAETAAKDAALTEALQAAAAFRAQLDDMRAALRNMLTQSAAPSAAPSGSASAALAAAV